MMFVSMKNIETRCSNSAASLVQWWVPRYCSCSVYFLKIRSVRMLDTIACSELLVWLFSSAWDNVILTLDVRFICSFVVIDPTN
jgi:hypothetical protein